MLLFLTGLFIFFILFAYHLVFKASLYPLRWLGRLIVFVLTTDRKLSILLAITLAIHFALNLKLGIIGYNTSRLDILTHFLFGYLSREFILVVDRFCPFIEKTPKVLRRYVTPTTLAVVLVLGQNFQEEIQKRLPLLASAVYTTLSDQLKDIFVDLSGIAFSAYKEKLIYLLRRPVS